MSETIQSISNGTYTIGETSATNFIAGPGISITEPSAGTVRIRTDETTLYSSDTAVAQGDTFSLSETPENFSSIKIYIAHANTSTQITWTAVLEYTGNTTRYDIILPATDNSNDLILDRFYFSRSGTTVTVGMRKRHIIGSSVSTATLSNPALIMKVIGINRISGGNA